ncbi:hypothetical protein ACFU5O_13600 [Streptomyces sp. NPDC057445]|uniref:hypothetical protein n=1 Tax=Streptomyces sp. NPDC057445 TaxID=3346136 RepID=UPI003687B88F
MENSLAPLIAATAQWLTQAYPSGNGALSRALAEVQAHQAVTAAARLRYPTEMDVALVMMTGPGGSARLDWIAGSDGTPFAEDEDHAWRSWVDEVVASWAASLLSRPELAVAAKNVLAGSTPHEGTDAEFRRLVTPGERDCEAAPLLRHPDLLAPVADLHHAGLLERLEGEYPLVDSRPVSGSGI